MTAGDRAMARNLCKVLGVAALTVCAMLLGVYTQCMGMDAETMKQVIREGVKPAFVELNLKAFQAGLERAKLA